MGYVLSFESLLRRTPTFFHLVHIQRLSQLFGPFHPKPTVTGIDVRHPESGHVEADFPLGQPFNFLHESCNATIPSDYGSHSILNISQELLGIFLNLGVDRA